jgi:hypothetical protein
MPIHGYPGNVITANPVAPTSTVATGVWTMEQQLLARSAGNWPFTIPTQQIGSSLRFNSADSAYLNRNPASSSNQQKWTWSGWIKRGSLGGTQNLFGASNASTNNQTVLRLSSDTLQLFSNLSGVTGISTTSNAVYRDSSAWYHIVCSVDTTQATSTNRVILYVNGSAITFNSPTYPTQNYSTIVNATGNAHEIGRSPASQSDYFNGYMTEINFIDGQALTPSSFGQTNVSTGVWEPIPYTGTYGTNGFELPFTNNTSTTTLSYDFQSADVTRILTSGSGTFTVPSYTTLTVELWGGGGGGGASSSGSTGGSGGTGGSTTFSAPTGTLTANGGAGGTGAHDAVANGSGGAGGTASGGDSNVTGNAGGSISGPGGNAPSGGDGNVRVGSSWTGQSGNLPGGGATGGYTTAAGAGSGGSGGYCKKTYTAGQLTVGSTISYSVGAGGTAGSGTTRNGGVGAIGGIRVTVNGSNNDWWNSYNFSVTAGAGNDSLVDSPTSYGTDTGVGGEVRGNYCTFNPLYGSTPTLTNGNLDATTNNTTAYGTVSVTSGKWYWEILVGNASYIGVMDSTYIKPDGNWSSQAIAYVSSGNKYNGTGSAYGASYTTNDIIGVALDMDAGTIVFYKNGSSQGTAFSSGIAGKEFRPLVYSSTSGTQTANFGQRPFTYTAPSGFKALCTQNLPTPTIGATSTTQANDYFNVALWTGTGSSQNITGLGFQPDFVWGKMRNAADKHYLFNQLAGVNKFLSSNLTDAETTDATILTSFNADGFTVGTSVDLNRSGGYNYVGWAWNAGGSTVTNTSGTISAQVRANTTSGFSIVTYTGNGSAGATIGHGLGVAPSMIIIKCRNSGAVSWGVYHASVGNTAGLYLNLDFAAATTSIFWNNTSPTSSVFSVGNWGGVNGNTDTYVAYCFAPVAGYSAFGSYTGNGSADGPFVYTGFRPAFVLGKASAGTNAAGSNWFIVDLKRNTYNVMDLRLFPNLNFAENTQNVLDFTSNGFKIRTTNTAENTNGMTVVYMAFAENPFKYSLAR